MNKKEALQILEEIKNRLKNPRQTGDSIRASCPFCGHHRAFIYNPSSGWFICFKCQERGNIRKLLTGLKFDNKVIEMAVKRRQAFQPIPKSVRKKHAWKTLPEYILDIYKTDKKVLPDQFTEASYSVSEVGFDKIEKRITFPIRDYLGELIGISGRATKDWQTPRYKVYTYPSVPNYYPENRKHLYLLDQVYPKQFFTYEATQDKVATVKYNLLFVFL